jgi:hypothetical protein
VQYADFTMKYHQTRMDSKYGEQLGLKLNYKLTERIGLGLTIANLIEVYWNTSMTNHGFTGETTTERFDISVGKVQWPRMSILFFLKEKNTRQEL